jgi:hypothetical protein
MIERRTLIALALSAAAIAFAALGAALPARALDPKVLQQPAASGAAPAQLMAQTR